MPTGIYKRSESQKEKLRKARLGKSSGMKGKQHTKETLEKIRKARLGSVPWNKNTKGLMTAWNKGIPMREETRKKLSMINTGKKSPWMVGKQYALGNKGNTTSKENHYKWISDRTMVKLDKERGGPLHKQWSKDVKKRDGWKCKFNNSDCVGTIVAHHIFSWRDYPELRYKIDNGITLCKFHHPLTRKGEKESIPIFIKLIVS